MPKCFIDGKRVEKVRHGGQMVPFNGIKRGMARVVLGEGRKEREETVDPLLCVHAGRTLKDWHDDGLISRRRAKPAYA